MTRTDKPTIRSIIVLCLIASTYFAAPLVSAAGPSFPAFASPFSSNAVIQRDAKAPIWGTAEPNSTVTMKICASGDDSIVFTSSVKSDKNGKWIIKTAKIHAGGPYTVIIESNGKSAALQNVLFGDVWICSGQSNMEMTYGWGLTNGKEFLETNVCDTIRLLKIPRQLKTLNPETEFEADWHLCEPEYAKSFSACSYFFGNAVKAKLPDVPIGLIDVAWSGTYIQTWISMKFLESCDDDKIQENVLKTRELKDYWYNKGGRKLHEKKVEAWEDDFFLFRNAEIKPGEDGFDYSGWDKVKLPVTFAVHIDPEFNKTCYYITSVELTDEQAAGPAELSLGTIDSKDVTTVNGRPVGETNDRDTERVYKIESGILHSGTNMIAVFAECGAAGSVGGGFTGEPEQLFLKVGDEKISLAGEWLCHHSNADPCPPNTVEPPLPNSYSACYNGMLYSLFPMAIKGVIWYQGCSNVGEHEAYYKLFNAMVKDWRSNFSGGNFPVYAVQLAAYMQTHKEPSESAWAAMRWTQMRLGEKLKNCGAIVTIDIGNHDDIHPKDKKTVGERLARLALVRTYKEKGIVESGPIPQRIRPFEKGSAIRVFFSHADGGLKTSDGKAVSGFQLAGEDGKFAWAAAEIKNNSVIVKSEKIKMPLRVRFAWDDYPVCNLVNGEGLPCGPFEMEIK